MRTADFYGASGRQILALGAAGLGGTLLTGCDRLSESSDVQEGLSSAEWLTYRLQRLLGGRHALTREFTAANLSPVFKVNGSHMPEGEEYAADWAARMHLACLAARCAYPARPRCAVAGLIASDIAATLCASNCTDDSPLFVATWYLIAIGIVVLAGDVAGSRCLRW